jgi:hypothetical protein
MTVVVGLLFFNLVTLFTYMTAGDYYFSPTEGFERAVHMYFATHCRYGPWLVGLMLAYLMHCQKDREIKLSQSIVLIGWMACVGTMLAVTVGYYRITQIDISNHSHWERFLRHIQHLGLVAKYFMGDLVLHQWLRRDCG